MKNVKVGIVGSAGYTGGELIRVLVNHPAVEIVFANSASNAGKKVYEVHEGLLGETEMSFTDEMPFEAINVLFLCMGHGKSEAFIAEHSVPDSVKIIDLSQDYRIKGKAGEHDFVYGLPEVYHNEIASANHLANPGCFATCIQLALAPAVKAGLISGDIHVNGITGSTGAGQKPGATTHYSWRNDNISVYKAFNHQHLKEISQTLTDLSPEYSGKLRFIPQRGCFSRGIFVTAYAKCDADQSEVEKVYSDFYKDAAFTHVSNAMPNLKQVVNTNKAVVYVERIEDELLMICCIDNLLKGAVGQAVQNMNLMFGLEEKTGLSLKASAF